MIQDPTAEPRPHPEVPAPRSAGRATKGASLVLSKTERRRLVPVRPREPFSDI